MCPMCITTNNMIHVCTMINHIEVKEDRAANWNHMLTVYCVKDKLSSRCWEVGHRSTSFECIRALVLYLICW